MYSLILGGGLGNQMFQYAYARALQEEFHIEFAFNLYSYNVDNTEIEERKFSLDSFNIDKKILFQDKEEGIAAYYRYRNAIRKKFLTRKLASREKSAQVLANIGCICSIADPYTYQRVIIKKKDGVIHGGFQSEKFFEKYADIIRSELEVVKPIKEKNMELLKLIITCNSIAVHIRRGDYLTERYSNLNICDQHYYQRAMEYIIMNVQDPIFFVFSNTEADVMWIKSNYSFFPANTVFVANSNEDYEDLQLMYYCKHFIISNSTFSWWAQYISNNNSKYVIAPKIWNRSLIEESNSIYQENWICL